MRIDKLHLILTCHQWYSVLGQDVSQNVVQVRLP
jgi:hypothetical protein